MRLDGDCLACEPALVRGAIQRSHTVEGERVGTTLLAPLACFLAPRLAVEDLVAQCQSSRAGRLMHNVPIKEWDLFD